MHTDTSGDRGIPRQAPALIISEVNSRWHGSVPSASGLITAGSVFLAADTWLGPFYFAYGRASGGQSSFYLYLGRP